MIGNTFVVALGPCIYRAVNRGLSAVGIAVLGFTPVQSPVGVL